MKIDDLIKEGENFGATMTKSPVPSNIIGIGRWYYDFPDSVGYWAWTNKCIMFLRKNDFIEESKSLKKYADEKQSYNLKHNYEQMISILKAVKDVSSEDNYSSDMKSDSNKKQIFVVYGHDKELKLEVEAFLKEELKLDVVVLDEKPNQGKTIIEKFEHYSKNAGYAVILMSPDDTLSVDGLIYKQARQNVVLELGYFMAKIGRERVCVILRGNVEKPSDISGILHLPYEGNWKYDLIKELKEVKIID